jgi:hypothetical protein
MPHPLTASRMRLPLLRLRHIRALPGLSLPREHVSHQTFSTVGSRFPGPRIALSSTSQALLSFGVRMYIFIVSIILQDLKGTLDIPTVFIPDTVSFSHSYHLLLQRMYYDRIPCSSSPFRCASTVISLIQVPT